MAITPTGILLTDIENAIVDRITTKVTAVVSAAVRAKGEGPVERYPSVYAATGSGQMRKIGNNLKVEPTVILILKFKDLRKEEDRRKGIYPILQGIISALFNHRLGLVIDALLPTGFRDITDDDDRQEGFIIFGMEIKTGFVMNTSEDVTTELLRVGLNYYTEPDQFDEGLQPAASDLVNLQGGDEE